MLFTPGVQKPYHLRHRGLECNGEVYTSAQAIKLSYLRVIIHERAADMTAVIKPDPATTQS